MKHVVITIGREYGSGGRDRSVSCGDSPPARTVRAGADNSFDKNLTRS